MDGPHEPLDNADEEERAVGCREGGRKVIMVLRTEVEMSVYRIRLVGWFRAKGRASGMYNDGKGSLAGNNRDIRDIPSANGRCQMGL